MRARLTAAAIAALIDKGYAGTTALEVCGRAGVTRGAFHHHFVSLAALYVAALEQLYRDFTQAPPAAAARGAESRPLRALVRRFAEATRRPQFKAVIEIWLAARNDAAVRAEVAPAIAQLSQMFSPTDSRVAKHIGSSRKAAAFYRLLMEATIGMALGRAVSPSNRPLAHEEMVLDLLAELADDIAR
ncbi:MAG: TetR/AcrR family transcriptional regulator [bacterium]